MYWFVYICWSPYWEVTNTILAPSVVVLLIYQFLDFTLKSPSTTIKYELDSAGVSKVYSKLSVKFSKPSLVCHGDRSRESNLYILEPTYNSRFILFCKQWILVFSVEANFWSRYIDYPFNVAMGGLIGLIHNPVFPNWQHVKKHLDWGMFQTNKLYRN